MCVANFGCFFIIVKSVVDIYTYMYICNVQPKIFSWVKNFAGCVKLPLLRMLAIECFHLRKFLAIRCIQHDAHLVQGSKLTHFVKTYPIFHFQITHAGSASTPALRITALAGQVKELPKINYCTLVALMTHLRK